MSSTDSNARDDAPVPDDSVASASTSASNKNFESGLSSGLEDTLRWAFELDDAPALAGATWLTREIVPNALDPFSALTEPSTTLAQLEELKNAFKMLRTTSTTAAERSLAARLYAAVLATALVRYGALITRQRGDALIRAFTELHEDDTMPAPVRDIALRAIDASPRVRNS